MRSTQTVLRRLLICGAMLCAAALQAGIARAQPAPAAAKNKVTAIDILLDPDAAMVQHATAVNAELLKNYPKGFTLGEAHAPHITLLHRYVYTADLNKMYAAASDVFLKENPTSWKLRAFKYSYVPVDKTIGLAAIKIEPTSDLLRLQEELIHAVAPFTSPTGTAAAFVTTPQDPHIVAPLIEYVRVFVPDHSGDHYSPHVTIGLGTVEYLDALLAKPFDAFTFSPVGASVYHLGNYGTAMAKLHSFKLKMAQTAVSPRTNLGIASVPNFRDVGGYMTADGSVVRRGVAYRSDQLNPITAGDMKKIAALNLKYDFDLRTAEERAAKPDELPAGVEYVWLDVLADANGVSAAEVQETLKDPKRANEALGGGKAAAAMVQSYREFITLPSANAAYHRLFVKLGEADQPSLFHCTTGKDRTGWAAAALLTLLGVPKEEVYEDYLRSNEYILPAYKTYIDRFVAGGGDPSIAHDILGVKAEYLQASFDEVKARYGSIESYFEKGLGIDAAGQRKLRDRFLQKDTIAARQHAVPVIAVAAALAHDGMTAMASAHPPISS